MFKEMLVNDTFQVQILASSVSEALKKTSEPSPGYEVRAAHHTTLPGKRVRNVNLGVSFAAPIGRGGH